ncbi:LysR family transcriptional regulator [Pelosinus baikalensis]|uniref:LysR family transcriptional regulator n=1 Tax=Pelosinus baikalensis TaxID=2892015 RepID=A0ABS8HU22_9FIRM|nr:LysR family transcriptional regulator [Pelosinus baikalensis]MCC5466670.1 LysR family transcriptional regulator [Pelosinus baikalensis]
MDTVTIEAFLAVIRHGSLTEAANSLFISQSTLSGRLAELEREVGMILIDRGRGMRTLTLTDQGKEFLVIAKRWEDLVQDTKRIQSQTQSIMLSIGAVDTIHTYVLPSLYQALRKYGKDLNVRLKTHNSTELYLQVDRGEIDVAFTLLDLPMRNIIVRKFYSEPRVVLRREMPLRNTSEFIDAESLDLESEIFFEGDPAWHTWYQRWKDKNGYPSLQVDTAQLLVSLLNKDGAWAIVPQCIAQKMVAMGPFAYYRLVDPPPERICYKIQAKYPKSSSIEGINILNKCLDSLFNKDEN